MRPDTALRVHAIDSARELQAIRPEWEALWVRSPRATPFQHPAWLLAWWRHLGGGPLCVVAVRDGARLAGIWPMYIWHDAVRQLTPLGNGVSDHVDLLAAPGSESPVAAAVLAHLAALPGWDIANFRDLPADSPLLTRELPPALAIEVEDDTPCPVLSFTAESRKWTPDDPPSFPARSRKWTAPVVAANSFALLAGERRQTRTATTTFGDRPTSSRVPSFPASSGTWTAPEDGGDALEGIVPREFLKKLCYYQRRIGREFTVTWEKAGDPSSLETLFDGLVRLHAARWGGKGAAGMLDDPRVAAFHRTVAAAFLARGMLRLYGLRLDGGLAAAWYGFSANGRTHYYLGGFDPALERHSIGTVMIGHAMEQAVREGATEFDFLRGGEAYKYAWSATDRPQRRLRITRGAAG